jgi:hypothetical protein
VGRMVLLNLPEVLYNTKKNRAHAGSAGET